MSKTKTSKKKTAKKTGEALTKQALAVTEANIARIEATERGEAPTEASAAESTKKKGKAPAKPKAKKERRMGLVDHAIAILKKHGKPMNCADIVKEVLAAGEWRSDGKTPAATLYSAVIREIAAKGKDSRFRKVERGQFALAAGAK